jgi:hypothetical protein
MNLIEKISYYQQVWKIAIPQLIAPETRDIRFWADSDPSVVEEAILLASNRFAASKLKDPFDVTQAYRWVTGTAKGIARRAKEAEKLKEARSVTVPAVADQEDNRGNKI